MAVSMGERRVGGDEFAMYFDTDARKSCTK